MATKKTTKKAAPKSTTKAVAKKTTKKAAPKKTVVKAETTMKSSAVSFVKPASVKQEKQAASTKAKRITFRKPYLLLIVIIILLGAALYYFRGLFVAAVVNGQPISRLEVIQQAEKQSGKQTLDTLIRDALIEQKAKQENVTVSSQEVNNEIAILRSNLKKQGQSLSAVLSAQGMTENDLRRLIRLNKLVQKMVGKNITVSNKEITDYINQNKSSLPSTNEAALRQQVKAQLLQQKTNTAIQSWLANLQKQANIVYFVQY